jgi:hypothetical protein
VPPVAVILAEPLLLVQVAGDKIVVFNTNGVQVGFVTAIFIIL